jgi:hypothetical protein
MKNSENLPFIVSTKNGDLATNKSIEALPDFQKNKIQETFVDIDAQLKEIAELHRQGNISKTRHFIIIQQIRNRLFELYNLGIHDLDVRRFASHEPGDKTPLNSGGCC